MHIETAFSGSDYRDVKQVEFEVDSETVFLAVQSYDYRFRRTPGRVKRNISDEYLTIRMPMDVVARIAGAESVTGRIAHVRFAFGRDELESLRLIHRGVAE